MQPAGPALRAGEEKMRKNEHLFFFLLRTNAQMAVHILWVTEGSEESGALSDRKDLPTILSFRKKEGIRA